ncbi:MAG: ATP synthase F0 subunit B [Candidatus Binatia bacterium]|nr:ATP synthase F0 subunit B [Candidatus Binatia bacterium]
MRKHLNTVVAVSFCSLVYAAVLWAAEKGHDTHGGHDGIGSQLLVLAFFTINFVLFVLLLRKYALPVVRDALRQRRAAVVQALSEAKRAREEAEELRREYEEKLAGLAAEQERLRVETLAAAEREKEKTLSEARRLAERIRAEAHMIAQREAAEAQRMLRQEVVQQAIHMATEMIRTHLRPEDHSRFLRNLAAEVNSAGHEGR